MSLGGQTVTLVTVTEGVKDGWGIPAAVFTETVLTGCHFRPLSAEETVALTDKAVEMWKLTAEPSVALLAATTADRIIYNGVTYEIVGAVRPYTDLSVDAGDTVDVAAVFKVSVICQRQQTGTA